MTQEMHEQLEKFLADKKCESQEEMNQALQEFMALYNSGQLKYEESDLVKAYNLLEQAESAKTKKDKIKYAKKALEVCPYCLEANLFLASLEESPLEALKLMETSIKEEKDRLLKEQYFKKDDIGIFYGIYETRPYIKGLYSLANLYTELGMINLAIDTCKEIIKLNNNDNMGARYLLMGLYAYQEDDSNMKKILKKYPEECLSFLASYLVLYYKKRNFDKAQEYLDKINDYNKHFISYFKGELDEGESMPGYYRLKDPSEVLMVLEELGFLFDSVYGLEDFILNEGIV